MAAIHTQTLTVLALLPLIGWRVVARFRRMVGRQRLTRARPWVTLALFGLLLALLVMAARLQGQAAATGWLALGLGSGGLLSLYGLRRTDYERHPDGGLWYVPHAPLGIVLSALFLLRVVWRVGELLLEGLPQPGGHESFTFSPWTLAPVGLFAGYSIGYAIGLLRARWRLLRQHAAGDDALSRSAGPG